jgi:DNA polymerase elongation subunit (family B)
MKNTNKSKTKILLFDIETMANLGWVWGKYEQNVIDFKQEWFILCFAYKWLGEKKVHTVSINQSEKYKPQFKNDYDVVKKLHELFSEADVIIAHNGDAFDIKKVFARFIYHGFTPPEEFKSIDTKKVAKRYFNFTSNKLDDLGRYLGLGRKLAHTGWDLWESCYEGDEKAWKMMLAYNKQDVLLLEAVYLRLLPYIKNHPDHNIYNGERGKCPNCFSSRLQKYGIKKQKNWDNQTFKCLDCGARPSERIKK